MVVARGQRLPQSPKNLEGLASSWRLRTTFYYLLLHLTTFYYFLLLFREGLRTLEKVREGLRTFEKVGKK